MSLRLTDAASGQITCGATVRAVNAHGSEVVFKSCYHAAVPRGTWTVHAQLPGYTTAKTPLIVPGGSHCDPAVQTIELTIAPSGYRPPPPALTPAPAPRSTVTAAASSAPSAAPPAPSPAAPPASAAPSVSPPPASATPPSPAAPPTGAFPAPPAP